MKKTLIIALSLTLLAGGRIILADGHHGHSSSHEDHDDDENEHKESRTNNENLSKKTTSLNVSSKPALVSNAKWKGECASCHMLYPPSLLPARSWTKLMGGLDKHFGENAEIDAKTKDEITKFLVANSAENSSDRRGSKINQSIASQNTPIRITETPYFIHKHDEIGSSIWKRSKIKSRANCIACHQNAEQGGFSEHEVSIPRS